MSLRPRFVVGEAQSEFVMNFRRRIIRGDYAKSSAFDLMADIFVSYAKPDRSLALKLVAMLEAEGSRFDWRPN